MKKLLPFLLFFAACKKSGNDVAGEGFSYTKTPQATALTETISEASGIADSKSNPGYLWIIEDSGNPPELKLLRYDGTPGLSVTMESAINRDWEEIVLSTGPGAGKNYLYVGDIGDNNLAYTQYSIYRLEEPAAGVDLVGAFTYDEIAFQYPDGSHDAEAFIVDPRTKDIFIITKRDTKSRIYRLAYPQSPITVNMAEFIAELPFSGVVSAALSNDANELIVKTYTNLYYWPRTSEETIPVTLAKTYKNLGYQIEPQGEAVSFANDQSGFFTLSEEALGVTPVLNFYKRN